MQPFNTSFRFIYSENKREDTMKSSKRIAEQSETLTGARMAQDTQTFPYMNTMDTQPLNLNDSDSEFTYFEQKVAKRFVELLGGFERARRILEKMNSESAPTIDDIANMIPDIKLQNVHQMSSLYNPSAIK
jgi:ABC-type amino acid transport substrate-binding protein